MAKQNIQLIILVIADTKTQYYINYINFYWIPFIKYLHNKDISIKCYLLFGSQPTIYIPSEYMIISNTNESLVPGILKKTVFGFQYVSNRYNFKHILRTNLSSFFILDNLINISNELGYNNIYSGCGNKRYHCGAAIWFSKDVIDNILMNSNIIPWELPDDVALWKLCKKIISTKQLRYDILPHRINKFIRDINTLITIIKEQNIYHIRIKTHDRYKDTELVKHLTNYYYK